MRKMTWDEWKKRVAEDEAKIADSRAKRKQEDNPGEESRAEEASPQKGEKL